MGTRKKQGPYSRISIVGKVIKAAMLRRDIGSQAELGALMGMSQAAVNRRFSGDTFWDLPELWRLDKILHFTDDELLTMVKCARR